MPVHYDHLVAKGGGVTGQASINFYPDGRQDPLVGPWDAAHHERITESGDRRITENGDIRHLDPIG